MKKYLSFVVSLILFTVSACTPSKSEPASSSKSASPSNSSDKAKDGELKTDSKSEPAATGWQDYSSGTGKFSVQMPNKPQELSQEQKTDVGEVKINMVLSESNTSAYMVGYNDYPAKFTDSEIPIRVTQAVKGFVTGSIKGEIKSSKEFKLGETPCIDFEGSGKIQSTDASAKGRICIADNIRLYQVVVVAPSDKFSNADADRFIASFKINK
ncbi:hypothetical protein APA_1359 [Pseudanabaena sp. lw0831]|uniref:hypothetical protein n=1 Tax=Pseudanabaena sp. lw0831 TaxID=1357935 RepID=UPI001914EDD2|nr:hypothetical protein [Pseudanabaena sp. lw0831]GBO53452.1 hypothetical protein APA_1359 [Pseudanabaena sp. lw0831]